MIGAGQTADVLTDLAAISADTRRRPDDRRKACAARRATECVSRADPARLSKMTGLQVRSVTYDAAAGCVTVDGAGGGIDWPVRVVNPPVLVADPAGPVARSTVEDGVRVERRYRVDPAAALAETLVGLIR